jgi:hypothetical protein
MAMGEKPQSFTLKITCDRTYLAGFPILVEVEVRNVDPHLITGIPYFDMFTVPGPVRFALSGGHRQWTWEPKIKRSESGPEGIDFAPGQVWTALQDLSELHPDLPPGHYQLTASMSFGREVPGVPQLPAAHTATDPFRVLSFDLLPAPPEEHSEHQQQPSERPHADRR